jgi:hypothetical protein
MCGFRLSDKSPLQIPKNSGSCLLFIEIISGLCNYSYAYFWFMQLLYDTLVNAISDLRLLVNL